MRQHDALGIAGGAGGVADDRDVLGLALVDFGFEETGMLGPELPPQPLHGLIRAEPVVLVVEHPARVVVHDEAERRQLGAKRHHLVDLLLVLGHDHRALGVVPDERELLGDRVLIDGHRHPAQALGSDLGPVEPRPVVADDRQPLAALEAEGGQAEREVSHLVVILAPRPGLPDAAVLLPDRRPVVEVARVSLQQSYKRGLNHGTLPASRSSSLRGTP